ncbi:BZ3500_MvSof-1268-A1-R1_Chr10-1g02650 [Microbotryum saponariae]|uniref:BZ3500_MvSof-1268-A1-R1_Chr10-1g02650 protein n=1 Tax=Microbotryum saponariae TaxID=289078 RepID=A0A2X0N2Z6_9BASI|nr:BZ3500_MvSof-1268-A1-R1_Chr10-1g02650 [Microbotryum saponariae]SDA06139.1 BZ3501_MvSof-1269-A2-R1_Chr10-1g02251 [Microbotryum saponariae]
MAPKRVCQIICIKPDRLDEYVHLHANAWPGVLETLERAHFKNYTIHHYAENNLLIAHFTYVGDDWEGDCQTIAQNEETRRWWALTDGMQESLVEGATGSGGEKGWWVDLPEVFHFEGSRS